MNRLLCIFLCFVLILSLSGCSGTMKEEASFYYCRSEYLYGEENSVVVSEDRDISGHTGELEYLLSLYLAGPLGEDLDSPFPPGTRLISVQQENASVQIEISELDDSVSDSKFSLGCACITLTCLTLADAEDVTIVSGERSVTMSRDNITLFDNNRETTSPSEESQ